MSKRLFWMAMCGVLAACTTSTAQPAPVGTPPAGVAPAAGAIAGSAKAPAAVRASSLADEVTVQDAGKVVRLGRGAINDMQLSPDGKLIALATSLGVQILDAATFREVRSIAATNGAGVIAFSPDGRTLATNDQDPHISLVDVAGGSVKRVPGTGTAVVALSFSGDGSRLAVGRADSRFQVHALPAGNVLFDGVALASGDPNAVGASMRLQLNGNGKTLFTTSFSDEALMWDVDANKVTQSLGGHSGLLAEIAISNDRARIATCSDDGTIRLWDAATGIQQRAISGHRMPVSALAFSPDGTRVASGDTENTLKIWQLADGREVGTTADTRFIRNIALGNDGILYSASGGALTAFDGASGGMLRQLTGFANAPINLLLSPDGKTLAYSDDEDVVLVRDWQSTSARRQTLVGHVAPVQALAFSPDGQWLVSGSLDDRVLQWNLAKPESAPAALAGAAGTVTSLGYSGDGARIIAITLENIITWEAASGKALRTARHRNPEVAVAAFNAARNWYAAAASNAIVVSDAGDDSVKRTLISANDTFFAITFSRDGRRIAAATEAGPLRVWDADTGAIVTTIASGSPAFSPAFSPDGSMLAYAREDHGVRIIELPGGRELRSFAGHSAEVISLAFADGRTLLSTSADGTVRVWRW